MSNRGESLITFLEKGTRSSCSVTSGSDQWNEIFLVPEHPGMDRHPGRLMGLVIAVDLSNLADVMTVLVDQLVPDEFLDFEPGCHANQLP